MKIRIQRSPATPSYAQDIEPYIDRHLASPAQGNGRIEQMEADLEILQKILARYFTLQAKRGLLPANDLCELIEPYATGKAHYEQ